MIWGYNTEIICWQQSWYDDDSRFTTPHHSTSHHIPSPSSLIPSPTPLLPSPFSLISRSPLVQAKTMFAMRHPVIPTHLSTTQRAAAAAAAASATPSPSLPGLAFAVCTAALPLLQRRDETVACAVLNTLKVALPMVWMSNTLSHMLSLSPSSLFFIRSHRYTNPSIPIILTHTPNQVCEPLTESHIHHHHHHRHHHRGMEEQDHGVTGGVHTHTRGRPSSISQSEIGRLQHLLHRIEQVLNFFPPGVPSLDYAATTQPATQCFSPLAVGKRLTSHFNISHLQPQPQPQQSGSHETAVSEDDGLLALSQLAFDAALARLVAELIRTIPPYLFHPKEVLSSRANQQRLRGRASSHHRSSNMGELELGTRTLQLIQEMVCRWYWNHPGSESVLPLATTTSLRGCLSDVDAEAYDGLKHAATLVEHAAKLCRAVSGIIYSPRFVFMFLPFDIIVTFTYPITQPLTPPIFYVLFPVFQRRRCVVIVCPFDRHDRATPHLGHPYWSPESRPILTYGWTHEHKQLSNPEQRTNIPFGIDFSTF